LIEDGRPEEHQEITGDVRDEIDEESKSGDPDDDFRDNR
jgi:hypothetical protein